MKWNVPLNIPLNSGRKTVVGRLPVASEVDHSECVVLHSQKLPYMLSRHHASLTYHQEQKRWMLTDLNVWHNLWCEEAIVWWAIIRTGMETCGIFLTGICLKATAI